jgi:hypothetical protein
MLYGATSIFVWMIIVIFGIIALALLPGVSRLTWADPTNAIACLLLGAIFVLHGVFITGASTFGPIRELDVGADPHFGDTLNLYTNVWETSYRGQQRIEAQLELVGEFPGAFTNAERNLYEGCITYCLDHNKNVFPVHVQVSSWDSHIYYMKFAHVDPPVEFGRRATPSLWPFVELLFGISILWFAFTSWRESRRRGVRMGVYDPFAILREAAGSKKQQ